MSKTKWYAKPIVIASEAWQSRRMVRLKARKPVSILIALVLVVSLGIVAAPIAGTVEASPGDVSGDITVDTTWSTNMNFTGDVTVKSGVTLTIEPGVTINLNGFSLIVNGVLDAQGTEGNMITFSSNPHIKLSGSESDDSILSYCDISSVANWPCIMFDDSDATVEHSDIEYTSQQTHRAVVKVQNKACPTIQYNTIKGDSSDHFPGFKSSDAYEILVDDEVLDGVGCNPTIIGNTIDGDANVNGDTSESGILITNGNNAADVSTATITGNTIINHRDIGPSGPYPDYAGINVREGCSATISGNTIDNNIHGIFLEGQGPAPGYEYSTATIEGNTIKNGDYGIYAILLNTPLTAHYNNIYGNTWGVYMFTPSMDATNNWWGSEYGPEDPADAGEITEVPDCTDNPASEKNTEPAGQLGDKVSDNVDYCPWLTAPYRPTTPMASFTIDHAKIDFGNPDTGKVSLKGTLELDLINGDGVDISEDVIVTVGTLPQTIPGNTMVKKGKKDEKWEYKRPNGDGSIEKMTINWKDGNGKFDISMDKADLTGITNPVTISIQIGDDFGEETILMRVRWDYKAPHH